MSKKFHIKPDGSPGVCHARISCPYGDLESEHYESLSEARRNFELKNLKFTFLKDEPFVDGANPKYHLTLRKNLNKIMKEGLIPQIGHNSQTLNEENPGIYLFSSLEYLNDANWLDEIFEDDDDIVVLEVSGVKDPEIDFYETVASGIIRPERIKITEIEI